MTTHALICSRCKAKLRIEPQFGFYGQNDEGGYSPAEAFIRLHTNNEHRYGELLIVRDSAEPWIHTPIAPQPPDGFSQKISLDSVRVGNLEGWVEESLWSPDDPSDPEPYRSWEWGVTRHGQATDGKKTWETHDSVAEGTTYRSLEEAKRFVKACIDIEIEGG
jgi:hypothetical protein